jgi:hypothetical protein
MVSLQGGDVVPKDVNTAAYRQSRDPERATNHPSPSAQHDY